MVLHEVITVKTCVKCKAEKPLDEFSPEKRARDGRMSRCKACHAEHVRNRYATDPAHAERKREQERARYHGEKLPPLPKPTADERFDEKWIEDENGCHIWQATITDDGYGMFSFNSKKVLAHRWNYARAYGPIPSDYELHHECEVPACVRPDHLMAMTQEAHREVHS